MKKGLMNFIYLFALVLLCPLAMTAQSSGNITVSGTVMDVNGKEISSVSVTLKGSPSRGGKTDDEGHFRLQNIPANSTLVFSHINYNLYELPVTESKEKLKVVLEVKVTTQDEVVVVGRGVQRKITTTGAVTNVNVKELQLPATSISNMLGGRVPGIISVTRSGEPGADFSEFWVRGISTFGASSAALVLIDGVEGNLNNVDPSDIESFAILKDASATAVFGVRGANGVVTITTKRGKAGALKVNFRGNSTRTESARMPDYVNAYDYAKLANEARLARGQNPVYSDVEVELFKTGLDPDQYPNVNWRDVLLKKSSRYDQYNINISGGGTSARYFMSLGYLNKEGIFKQDNTAHKYDVNTNYKKYNFRANVDVDLTPTTKLSLLMDDAIVMQGAPAYGTNNDYLWSSQALITPVASPLRFSNGQMAGYGASGNELTPYFLLNNTGFKKIDANTINAKVNIDQDLKFLTPGLTARGLFSWTYAGNNTATHSKIAEDVYRQIGRSNSGELVTQRTVVATAPSYGQSAGITRGMYMEAQLNYVRRFNEVHNVSALVHYYRQEDITSDVNAYELPYMSIIPLRTQTVSARVTYSYKDIYLLEGNVGYSGSENFRPGEQYGLFPAVSAGWVPTQYDWTRVHLPFLTHFKLRGSIGKVGNSKIVNAAGQLVRFPYQTILSTGSNQWGTAITETKIGMKDLKWQTSIKYNLGVDMKLFDNAVDIIVDIFKTNAKDIYQQRVTIPEEVGSPANPWLNTSAMKSWGADGTLAFTKKVKKDLEVTLRGNFTITRNKVTHYEQAGVNFPYQSYTGVPYGVQRGLIALGLFKDDADINSSPRQTFMSNYLPGDIKYKDVNGDGIIDTDDIVPLNYSNVPRIVLGFAPVVSYKKWTASLLFTHQDKVSYFLGGTGYYPFVGESTGNVLRIVANPANRWIPASLAGKDEIAENPNARFPRLTYGNNTNNNRASTFWLADASFVRLQNAEINYKWECEWLRKKGIAAATFSLLGYNLAVWDKVKLWDPEQASSNGAKYPIQRTYTVQLYLNFK
ncbi:SusC/RagA family TonB-linked outer membrane protein [Filimonas effusa]|uniref:TonB-dependent receptor n=1 Tax=Filimonas effusa TaxID=2508721 RepID=A0A4Q1DDY1_9BACT|nr:TonB-dependent receptor [Filimonas effusa]RXK87105.1 TonB-dependent receptor [Filimonas effusa]